MVSFLLFFGAFLLSLATSLTTISLPLFLTSQRGAGPFLIGLTGFAWNFMGMIVLLATLRISFLRKIPWFIFVPLLLGICYLAIPFVPTAAIFLLIIGATTCNARFWPSIEACFRSGKDDEQELGTFNLCWPSGVIAGMVLAGILFARKPSLPFVVAATLPLLLFALFQTRRKELVRRFRETHHETFVARESFPKRVKSGIRIMIFILAVQLGSICSLYPRLAFDMKIRPEIIGILIGAYYAAQLLVYSLLRRRPLLSDGRVVFLCYAASALCFLVFSIPRLPVPAVFHGAAIVIAGLAFGVAYHNSIHLHVHGGFATEIHEAIISAGAFIGALATGTLGEFFGLHFAFLAMGTVIVTGGWFFSGNEHNSGGTPAVTSSGTAPS